MSQFHLQIIFETQLTFFKQDILIFTRLVFNANNRFIIFQANMSCDFHGVPLTVSWLLLIDASVIAASLRWQKFTFYGHFFLGALIVGLTFGATIPMIQSGPLIVVGQAQILNVHQVVGFMVTVWMCYQFLTGLLTRTIQFFPQVPPVVCMWIKRSHNISGYIIMILSKFNYLGINFQPGQYTVETFVLLLIADIILISIYIWLKLGYWTLSQEIVDPQVRQKSSLKTKNQYQFQQSTQNSTTKPMILNESQKASQKSVQSSNTQKSIISRSDYRQKQKQKQIITQQQAEKIKTPKIKPAQVIYTSQTSIQLQKYILFNDFVYNTQKLKRLHPGGEFIIQLMNKRQVNRFIYGAYTAQITPKLQKHEHSKDSMRLIGRPVGRVQRLIPIRGLNDYNKVSLSSIRPVVPNSVTYLVYLKVKTQNNVVYLGFSSESSIGQFFSLTIGDQKGWNRVTRLYTTVWCMRKENIEFMKKLIPEMDYQTNNNRIGKKRTTQMRESNYEKNRQTYQTFIPLVIKKYPKGKLTPRFLTQEFKNQIVLSKPMGCGMSYQSLPQQGKIIIICGGTGLLPFCDFIDLLFKRVKFLQNKQYSRQLLLSDPVINKDLIKNRQFVLYCAAQTQTDLLPLTLYQINYLIGCWHIKFSAIFRIKQKSQQFSTKFKNIPLQKGYFNDNIVKDIKTYHISKLYICGSPDMNSSIGKILIENNFNRQNYHFM